MQKGQGEDTTVTWEDQQNINTFGRLNSQLHELEDEIKAKQKVAEDLEDAGNELILTDEEDIRYMSGEVFIHTPKDDVEGLLEQLTENNRREMEDLVIEKERIAGKLAELKQILYGKFHDQINLEEE